MTESAITTESLTTADAVRGRRDEIWEVLEKTDNEYFPPLSVREPGRIDQPPTVRQPLWPQPVDYFNEILKEHVLLAYSDEKPVGMISYVPRFDSDTLANWSPCTYIDTVGVIPGWRRRGIARLLYRELFQAETVLAVEYVALRTWSTNISHITLILDLGFTEIDRHLNERAPGVDTVYFVHPSTPSPFTD